MKKFLALVLALLMALSCFSFAGAETVCQQHEPKEGTGHKVTDATCTTAETWEYECSRCNKTYRIQQGTPAGHLADDANKVKVTPANCEHGTITEYKGCARCEDKDVVFTVEADDRRTHNWKLVPKSEVPATCTTAGTKQEKCDYADCGATRTVVNMDDHDGEPLGHAWSTELVNVFEAPTCAKPGVRGTAWYCTRTGCTAYKEKKNDGSDAYTRVEIPQLSHSAEDSYEDREGNPVKPYGAFISTFFTVEDGKLTGINNDFISAYHIEEKKQTVKVPSIVAYGATNGFEIDYKAVTCTEDGHLTVTCLDCGKSWTATAKATGHDYSAVKVYYVNADGVSAETTFELKTGWTTEDVVENWKAFVESHNVENCTNPVDVHYVCGKPGCKAEVEAEGFTLEHDFAHGTIVGYRQQKYGEQLPVEYTAAEVDNVAKCQPYTVITRCKYCAQLQETAGKVVDHVLDDDDCERYTYEEPTCTKEGSELVKCLNCNYTVLRTLAKDKHHKDDKKTVIVAATCTKAGSRTFTCKDCGHQWTEVIPALTHKYEVTKDEPGTCTKAAVKVETCKYCGDTKTTTGSLGHTLKDRADIKVEYNGKLQLKDGAKEYTVLGVKWDDCAEEGRVQFICGNCCELITIENKAGTAHEWSLAKGNADYPGTVYEGYTAEGYKVKDIVKVDEEHCKVVIEGLYTCANCKKPETREFSIEIKHEPDEHFAPIIESGKEPTCTKAGEGYYRCEHCGKLYKAAVEAKLHHYETTWDGEKWVYTCTLCGDVKTLEFTAEKYVIDLKDVTFGARTEGYATVKLENSLTPDSIFGTRYAYIRWTWTGANNEKWVAEDTRMIVDGKIDMKGMKAPVGTTLTEVLVIVTGEKNADSMQLGDFSNYGHVIK